MSIRRFVLLFSCLAAVCFVRPAQADKIRDLCDVVGARDNQLVGYGVVIGLNGTGDDASAPFASQSMRSLLRRLGVQVDAKQIKLRNIAAVVVIATIPSFVRSGSKLDVTVASVGSARSLRGGVLVQTPLRGADRKTYAVAQGSLLLGGFSASSGSGTSVTENSTTTARIPGGSLVEREIRTRVNHKGTITLALKQPDFSTAQRIVEAVEKSLGGGSATALDGGSIRVKARGSTVALLAKLTELEVTPIPQARIVINERTGTIVAGGNVRLSPVAIAQGGITITVQEAPKVSQPNPLSKGQTTVVTEGKVEAVEQKPQTLSYLSGAASLADVSQALSSFGIAPRELASLLQALKAAGALNAEIIVQ
jgi:flagellar P-ring protein precursor FlgI